MVPEVTSLTRPSGASRATSARNTPFQLTPMKPMTALIASTAAHGRSKLRLAASTEARHEPSPRKISAWTPEPSRSAKNPMAMRATMPTACRIAKAVPAAVRLMPSPALRSVT